MQTIFLKDCILWCGVSSAAVPDVQQNGRESLPSLGRGVGYHWLGKRTGSGAGQR